jgi:hypothetical protein
VRKSLGVLGIVAALCLWSSAQSTGENPKPGPQYPRAELFGGYSYGYADMFNSGHRVGLQGWNVSVGLNAAKWIGFVFEANGLYGTSKIPVGVPAPFPTCPQVCTGLTTFNVDTKNYNYLFGAQFPYRKWDRLTPFGELMFGHSGVRGEVPGFAVASGGLGLLAGVGADYSINKRFALRLKADYLGTRTSFALLGHQKQDNLRVSVGIVIRSVRKKKKTLEDVTPPEASSQ